MIRTNNLLLFFFRRTKKQNQKQTEIFVYLQQVQHPRQSQTQTGSLLLKKKKINLKRK